MKRSIIKTVFITAISITFLGLSATTVSAQTKVHHTVKKTTVVKKTIVTKKPTAAELADGKGLLLKSDCLTCHKLDVKLIGPAYYDVAKKYPATEANYTKLADKVISGGSGVWGQIPMAPHPTLTLVDAKKIVKYILSLKAH